jgi:tetratricopeptide (TPR) repeat protein
MRAGLGQADRTFCASRILCADTGDEAKKRYEDWLCGQREGKGPAHTLINKMIVTQFVDQLLMEKDCVPTDWQQIANQARLDLESIPADDFDLGYWLDANEVIGPSDSLEAFHQEMPADIRSGLNWAEDKQFFFLLSVLSPAPLPLPESADDAESGDPDDAHASEETDAGVAVDPTDSEADFPQLASKEAVALIRARNSAVAAWVWRKYAARNELAGNRIRIDPWCGVMGPEARMDPDTAIVYYTKAIELNPKGAEAHFHRAEAKQAKGDLDGALADLTKAIELEPEQTASYNNRSIVRKDTGDLDGAIADCNKAIELDPADAFAYWNRGLVKKAKGDLDGAITDYSKSIEISPDSTGAYVNRGLAKHANGDLDGAMADYMKASELNPKYAWAYHARGCLRYDAQMFDDALVDFRKVLEINSSIEVYAHFRICLIQMRLGETDAATKELLAYLSGRSTRKPDDWASTIGRFLVGQIAESEFLASVKIADKKTEATRLCQAYFYAGSKYLFANDRATAMKYFQKSIDTEKSPCTEHTSAMAELSFLKK